MHVPGTHRRRRARRSRPWGALSPPPSPQCRCWPQVEATPRLFLLPGGGGFGGLFSGTNPAPPGAVLGALELKEASGGRAEKRGGGEDRGGRAWEGVRVLE